jgi:hypothetical protein
MFVLALVSRFAARRSEVPALAADVLAGEELPDDLDCFLQAFVADPRSRLAGGERESR